MGVTIYLYNRLCNSYEPVYPSRSGVSMLTEAEALAICRDVSFRASHVINGNSHFSVTNRERRGQFEVAARVGDYQKLADAIAQKNPDAIVIVR